jgi:hypothetical protein
MSNLDNEIKTLEATLKDLKKKRDEERREKQNSVKPIYRFTLSPDSDHWHMEDMQDDSLKFVRLEGIVTNQNEMEAVGNAVFQGGMTYIFNRLSGKIAMAIGGGNVWLSTRPMFSKSDEERESARKTFDLLSAFLRDNPEGGDVTEIVTKHRAQFDKP